MNPNEVQKTQQNDSLLQSNVLNDGVLGQYNDGDILAELIESVKQENQACAENDKEAIQANIKLAEYACENPDFAPYAIEFSNRNDAINQRRHEDTNRHRKFAVIITSILGAVYIITKVIDSKNHK